MAAQVGEAIIRLSFDGKGIKSELSNIEKDVESSSSKVTGALKTIGKVGVAAFTAAASAASAFAIKAAKAAIKGYGEYEQLVGGVDTLFKDASEQVQQYADIAYKTAQISANEYMSTVTSFSASLIQSLGGDTQRAAEYANSAIIDMADNANKMGTSMESIQNAYQGFAKQNYTMLDNLKLGYGGTRGEMQRLLEDAEKISGVHYEIGNFADMTAAIHVIQKELGITGTSAEEASKTIQGSLNSMKASWANLIVGVANSEQDFGTLMENFIASAETFISNVMPVIETALPQIATLIDKLAPIIIEKLPTLIQTLLPPFINVVTQIALVLIQNAPAILTMILNGFLAVLPSIVQSIVAALPQIIQAIIDFLTNEETINLLLDAAIQLFMALVMAVPQILGGLVKAFGTLVGSLWKRITGMFGEFAANFGTFISNIFKGAINGVIAFIENFLNTPINIINGFIGIINDAFGWLGVNLGRIDLISLPRLAQGGIANGATTAIIGEEGKEAVLPLENNTDNWAGLLAQTLVVEMQEQQQAPSGTINVYMTNEINNRLDAEEIGQIMMQSIRRAA